MKRCSKCILPEFYPNITFDDKRECNYCKAHQKIQYLGPTKLEDILAKYKKRGGKYDCLVPVSGGKDSSYVLYQMSKVYHMRVLAFHHDNCFTHLNAKENIQRMVNSLGVDLVTKIDNKQRKFMATNLKAYLRKPSVAMVPMLCTGCRYGIIGNAFNISTEYDIPMVIIGWSPIEDTPFKEAYLRNQGNSVMGGLLLNLCKNPSYIRLGNMIAAIIDYYHSYQHIKDWNIVLRMLYPALKLIQFYDYVPYNPDEIQQVVVRELNWKMPDKNDSWQFDCKLKLLQNYFYLKEAGFTATDAYLSALVREGLMSRSEALERLEYSKHNKDGKLGQIHEFLKDMNLEDLLIHFS